MKKDFNNEIVVNKHFSEVKKFLNDINNLKEWDPEVASTKSIDTDVFQLIRRGPAINSAEYIKISTDDSNVEYKSFGGLVEYIVNFELEEHDGVTTIKEKVVITSVSDKVLKIESLIYIAQKAFNENLERLKQYLENINIENENATQKDFDEFMKNREALKQVEKHFFDNSININTSKETLIELLANIKHIIEWDHDIRDVQEDKTGYRIVRSAPSINEFEHIQIEKSSNDEIIYISTGGLVEYKVIFKVISLDEKKIHLTESVYLTGYPEIPIPFEVFKPTTQNAFYEVLNVLKGVAELEEIKKN